MEAVTKNVVIGPDDIMVSDAIERILRAVSFFTGSPAAVNKIPSNYNQIAAVKDLINALEVFQDKTPGYDLKILRLSKSATNFGTAIAEGLKLMKKFC